MGAQVPEELLDIQHTPGTEWLILDALPPEDTVQIACRALGVAELPEEVAALIRVRSAGSPLFCQELAFAVRETGLIRIENGVCFLARDLGDLSAIDLPGTVDSAIIARIDRLSPSQRMGLKVASVIGRVFSAEALESLYPFRSDSPLENDLSSLAALRIIVREQSQGKETYYFSHMLIRDVAYSLMLYSQRRQLHQGMAERLEQSHAANLESVYALLAYHWSRAAPEDGSEPKAVWKAVTYLQKAGEQALRQYIVRDAITLLSDALRILGRLPEDEARDRKELELQCALGGLLIASRGFAAPETEQAFSQGWELGRKLKDAPEFYGALGGLWNISVIRGQLARARELAREMLQFAEAIPTGELLVSSNRAVGETAFWRGELDDAQLHLRRCLALYRPEQHAIEAFRTGQDPAVVAHGFLSWTLWLTGFPDEAVAEIDQGLALAESLKHPFSVAMMLQFYSMLHYYRREPELAKAKSARLIELAQKEGFALWIQSALMINGWARAEEGEIEEGIVDIQRGLAGYRATGAMLPVPFCLSMLADTLGRAGRVGEGLAVIAEALDLSYGNEEGWWRAELHHVQAKLLLAMSASNHDAADSELRQAMSVASKQNARSLELRAEGV
jgi:predicted ATPase